MMKHSLKALLLTMTLPVSALVYGQVPVFQISGSDASRMDQGFSTQSAQSELILLVQQLQEEVQQLRGELETAQHKLNRLEADSRDRYRDVDRRLSVLMQAALESADAAGGAPMMDMSPAPAEETAEAAPTPATPSEASSVSDQEAYDQAFALVRERRFAEAIKAFEAFVQSYPDRDNTANGYYWLGELYLAQQTPAQARVHFEKVLEAFASHHKVPDTMYKLGVTYAQLGEMERSRSMLSRVQSEFPQSTAATLARNYRPPNQ
ncbi:tol-pal system protein YbgF [Nitrincola tapanii]|uniref:Cell division coordinator CpoB n=2 Tax=Nitrincola tapanii TaxID=1708751 RepID=A0A5A9W6F9_9GAMM|nr:tol-pal system protein YbgF [Nitrincola tapanii]